ncbi:MAG: restriction endonuclease subunit S, partial [Desulfobacterium sp.]|nr:restriction endonuclease subunit S [Desulfobacterium sp.]
MEQREGYKKTKIGWIPEDWRLDKMKKFSTLITKGTTPTTLGFSYQDSGINFVKIESIDSFGQFIPKLFAHISEDANFALKRSILHEHDLLFSIAGALGRVAIVNKSILPANTNQALAIIRLNDSRDISRNYLMVYLKSQIIKDHIQKISVQSAQANVSLNDVNNFPIPLPPLPEQQKIASI